MLVRDTEEYHEKDLIWDAGILAEIETCDPTIGVGNHLNILVLF